MQGMTSASAQHDEGLRAYTHTGRKYQLENKKYPHTKKGCLHTRMDSGFYGEITVFVKKSQQEYSQNTPHTKKDASIPKGYTVILEKYAVIPNEYAAIPERYAVIPINYCSILKIMPPY